MGQGHENTTRSYPLGSVPLASEVADKDYCGYVTYITGRDQESGNLGGDLELSLDALDGGYHVTSSHGLQEVHNGKERQKSRQSIEFQSHVCKYEFGEFSKGEKTSNFEV